MVKLSKRELKPQSEKMLGKLIWRELTLMLIYYSFIETLHCRAAVKSDRSIGGRLLQLWYFVEDFNNWEIMPYLEREDY